MGGPGSPNFPWLVVPSHPRVDGGPSPMHAPLVWLAPTARTCAVKLSASDFGLRGGVTCMDRDVDPPELPAGSCMREPWCILP